jgi:hypothetical protein
MILVRGPCLRSEAAGLLLAGDACQARRALTASPGKPGPARLARVTRFVILKEDRGKLPRGGQGAPGHHAIATW